MPDLAGRVLRSQYRVEKLLGEGMMGQVWQAWDLRRQWPVALKVMRSDFTHDREFLRYFEREAADLALLQHPAIVRLYSFEQDRLADGISVAFLVLEFVNGRDLQQRLAGTDAPLPLPETLSIARHILSALSYAHQEGAAHGDVKPANILLTDDGRAVLSDFGLVRHSAASSVSRGAVLGSPAYMVPECWDGAAAAALARPQSQLAAAGPRRHRALSGERPGGPLAACPRPGGGSGAGGRRGLLAAGQFGPAGHPGLSRW